ncbi:MAG TPA: DinB family protein [Nocardioides sp.]|nr:DinB family protein [Nocardioides sp.]
MGNMWTDPESDPRSEGNPEGELATLRAYLTNYRLTLQMKCDDLDPEQLARQSVPPSNLSLLGLLRHMASVEQYWFQRWLTHDPRPDVFPGARDSEFDEAVGTQECVDEAFTLLRTKIQEADAWLDDLDESRLGELVTFHDGTGAGSIRDILVHMIEEYARHCGHADLLRECIDGRTGQ